RIPGARRESPQRRPARSNSPHPHLWNYPMTDPSPHPLAAATPASRHLLHLARRVAAPYGAWPGTQAILVVGSVAAGLSDAYSDPALVVYQDIPPADEELAEARRATGGELRWAAGSRAEGELSEASELEGVECQFAHTTLAAWERDMDRVLVNLDV